VRLPDNTHNRHEALRRPPAAYPFAPYSTPAPALPAVKRLFHHIQRCTGRSWPGVMRAMSCGTPAWISWLRRPPPERVVLAQLTLENAARGRRAPGEHPHGAPRPDGRGSGGGAGTNTGVSGEGGIDNRSPIAPLLRLAYCGIAAASFFRMKKLHFWLCHDFFF
jgi:hypothetical protein